MPTQVLETRSMTIGYHSRKQRKKMIAKNISLALIPGEVVCLIGPNGAGKSTLLRTLSGLQPPLEGTVWIHGQELSTLSAAELAKNVSIVLTERVNVGMLSVFGLVALGRYPYTDWRGKLLAHDVEVVNWAIRLVGAQSLAARNVNELSDGERQKVMIARALAQQPEMILLDEPTAFLDLPHRIEMMSLLRQLARETETAILLSTHDLELALRTADKIWLLPVGETMQVGAPEDLVLSGAFERAFQHHHLQFDMQQGAFVIPRTLNKQVQLDGDGDGFHALWTRKALEREGFMVNLSPHDAPIRIQIERRDGIPIWNLNIKNELTNHPSIYELLAALRTHAAGNGSAEQS